MQVLAHRLVSDGDDVSGEILTPEIVLPEQLLAPRSAGRLVGERALMLAVLEDAIRCLQDRRSTPRIRELACEAAAWVAAVNDDWPFSFVNICEALDLDPDRLRTALATLAPASYRLHLRLKPRGGEIRPARSSRRRA
jgi:hypothetical protein